MIRVLGIDPGINITGYGVLDHDGSDQSVVTFGTIIPPRKKSNPARLAHLYAEIANLIREFSPTEIAVEEAFFSKNARTAFVLGQARGMALLAAARHELDCYEYAPKKVKLSVVGNGSASKEQVQYMVKSILSLKQLSEKFDVTDALAVALCHINQLRSPVK